MAQEQTQSRNRLTRNIVAGVAVGGVAVASIMSAFGGGGSEKPPTQRRAAVTTSTPDLKPTTTTTSTTVDIDTETTQAAKRITQTTVEQAPRPKAPEQLLQQSSLKTVRVDNTTSERTTWCDSNAVMKNGKAMLISAGHCNPGEGFSLEIQTHDGHSVGKVTEFIANSSNEPSGFLMMNVSGDLEKYAIPFKTAVPTPGQKLISYGAAAEDNFKPEFSYMVHKGEVLDGAEGTPLYVAEADERQSKKLGQPGKSGGIVMTLNGEIVGVIHGDVSNEPKNPGDESKQDEYGRQMRQELGDNALTIAPASVN